MAQSRAELTCLPPIGLLVIAPGRALLGRPWLVAAAADVLEFPRVGFVASQGIERAASSLGTPSNIPKAA